MVSHKKHFALSMERTGKDYKELHQWIDTPSEEVGFHRESKHDYKDEEDVKHIKKEFGGEEAYMEFLYHLLDDFKDTNDTNQELKMMYRERFIHYQNAFEKSYLDIKWYPFVVII
tara:strand:- start:290 stop:634 length:345 start_codon:yes stop_codon:yes gene_type:complete